ncbi:MAG: hypothetical protein LBU05_04940, partial [Bifidobacteriaceae bacterium]|nr:hypothetical protein [Bifidobacteriaceae bacterium]
MAESKKPGGGISVIQVLASALAAVTSTVALSYLGVGGTILGAALASVITVVGNFLYSRSLDRTHKVVKNLAQQAATIVLPAHAAAQTKLSAAEAVGSALSAAASPDIKSASVSAAGQAVDRANRSLPSVAATTAEAKSRPSVAPREAETKDTNGVKAGADNATALGPATEKGNRSAQPGAAREGSTFGGGTASAHGATGLGGPAESRQGSTRPGATGDEPPVSGDPAWADGTTALSPTAENGKGSAQPGAESVGPAVGTGAASADVAAQLPMAPPIDHTGLDHGGWLKAMIARHGPTKTLVAIGLAVFLLIMAAVTAAEVLMGHTLSDELTGRESGRRTTFIDRPASEPAPTDQAPAPSAPASPETPTPTDAEESPTVTPTPSDSASPASPEPSDSADPSGQP